MPFDFASELAAAVTRARSTLNSGSRGALFDPEDDRARAYLDISAVLRQQYSVTQNSRWLEAARMLEEQAEITTYSGDNGTLALLGNFNAKLRGGSRYDVPLDVFSWEIDEAVISFFETVVEFGQYNDISANSIRAVDALVWDNKGLLPYFPGLALGVDFTILGFDHSVWRMDRAAYDQYRSRTFGAWDFIQGGGLQVLQAFNSTQPIELGKSALSFGFSDTQVNGLSAGSSIQSADGRWVLSQDNWGRRIVTSVSSGSIAWVDNGFSMAGWDATIGQGGATRVLGSAAELYKAYGDYISAPRTSGLIQLNQTGYDAFKNFLGADLGPGGVRFDYITHPNLTWPTYDQLIARTPGAKPTAYSYTTVTGATSFTEVSRLEWGGGTIIIAKDVALVNGVPTVTSVRDIRTDANGQVTAAVLGSGDTARELDLTADPALREQLQAFADATDKTIQSMSGEGAGALASEVGAGSLSNGPGGPTIIHDSNGGSDTITVTNNSNLFRLQVDPETGALLPRGLIRRRAMFGGGDAVYDYLGREVTLTVVNGEVVQSSAYDGLRAQGGFGVTVVTTYQNGHAVDTNIKLNNNPVGIEFSDAGAILGAQLGSIIAGGNVLTGVLASATLQTIGDNLGDVLDGLIGNQSVNHAVRDATRTFGPELVANLKSAGIGALSSFLTAELVHALGVNGVPGELLNTAAGAVINTVITNIAAGKAIFDGLSVAQVGTAVGSFIGNKLANEVISFDTVGGQIGSAVGSAIGSMIGAKLLSGIGWFGGPLGALVGAFVGTIVGGLIGSLFGGTPKSGADVLWDEGSQSFKVANAYSKHGGSKDAAKQTASVVADTFNAVLEATGGRLENPLAVQSGNYGMRKDKFVYRPVHTKDSDDITAKFGGDDGAAKLIGYGIYQGLKDPDFKIVGGDTYVKRALYNTLANPQINGQNFDAAALLGNIASAQRYETYLQSSTSINALIVAEPDSAFAAEWALTLAQAVDLGLTKRHESDWYGGFTALMDDASVNAGNVTFGADYDPFSDRISRLIALGDYVLTDSIDVAGQTMIEGTSGNDTITLTHTSKAITRGGNLIDLSGWPSDETAPPTGAAAVAGWLSGALDDETRWTATTGPGGEAIVAMEAGQLNGDAAGGGQLTKTFSVDTSKAYEFTIYVRRDGAEQQGIVWGIGGDGTAFAQSLATGTGTTAASFVSAALPNLVEDRWYKIVGYVLPAGSALQGAGTIGGIFDPVTGEKVADTEAFRWASGITSRDVSATFSTTGATGLAGFTTSFFQPEVREVMEAAVVNGADRLANSFGLTIDGMASDGMARSIDVAATIDAGDGDDVVHGGDMGNNIFGGAGNDTLYGGRLDDWLLGGDGNDTLDASDGSGLGGDGNYLDGGAGNDIVTGREGSDWLEGGDGVDRVVGGSGDDILSGGAGDGDVLEGGADDDSYLIRRGDGIDIAEDVTTGAPQAAPGSDYVVQRMAGLLSGSIRRNWVGDAPGVVRRSAVGGEDSLVFGAGITLGDVVMQRSPTDSDDLIVRVMQTVGGVTSFSGTELTVKDWFSDYFKRIEWMKFADGTEVRIGDITSFIVGGTGNDVLIGTGGNDFVYGGEGDDQLNLMAGDDIGNGGMGNDLVAGHSGADLLVGGLGADELIGGKGKDALSGDGGGDDLYGGDDNDILSGGRGDGDVVVGGAGNDTFKYSRGDGRDQMFDDYNAAYWGVVWTRAGLWNTAAGFQYNPETGEVTGPNGSYLRKDFGTPGEPNLQWVGRFDFDDVTGTLKVFNPPAGAQVVVNNGTDTIEFAPGINIQDIVLSRPVGSNDLVFNIATENSEFGAATSISDSITIRDWYVVPGQIEQLAFYQTGLLNIGAGVTNLIAGTDLGDGTDNAPLAGTSGADWITSGAGDDVVAGGSGNDIINGNSGSDKLKGEAGDDVIYGGAGNDLLDGGIGSDVLIGGIGSDTASYASSGGGVRAHLSATVTNTGDAVGDEYSSIENLLGGGGADLLGGDDGDNELAGGVGNDTLLGGLGDDTYIWSAPDGADIINDAGFTVEEAVTSGGTLNAGFSVTTWERTTELVPGGGGRYYWRLQVTGPGGELVYDAKYVPTGTGAQPQPQISAWDPSGWLGGFARTGNSQQVGREQFDTTVNAGDDVLELGQGISLSDPAFITSGNDLIVRFGGSATSQITIRNHFTTNSRVETLQFSDGLAVSLASILSSIDDGLVNGTSANDLMQGRAGALADQLDGGAGNDVLSGGAGDDVLRGGDGDDVIEGGAGADRIDGGAHSAATVTNFGDTARYVRSAAGVQVDLRNTTGGQAGGDAAGDVLTGIENVVGSQFGDTLTGDAGDNRLFGLDGNDVISGGDGSNVLVGGSGDDTITGGSGVDTVDGGDGVDVIDVAGGNDLVQAGAGNDRVYGGAGDDQLLGGSGDDRLEGGIGADVLQGEEGNDTLLGGDGNDQLSGGQGNDNLQGEAGDDAYLFGANSGSDTIVDAQGANSIVFDQPVSFDRLWLTRQGNDLRVAVIGGDTVVTISGFFASASPSRVRSISTAEHSIYLDYASPLITAMTAAGSATPAAIPASVGAQLGTYWHEGHLAAPTASPISLTTAEDVATPLTAVTVVDHDNNISGFRLGTGPRHGAVTVNGSSGAFVFTPDADFNGSDAFTIIATDADGQAAEVAVTVNVTAVNDAPRDLRVSGGTLSILENADPGDEVGRVQATDVEGDHLIFSLVNDAGGRFVITNDGRLLVQNSNLIDHEAAGSHVVRVRVVDTFGAAAEGDFTVTIGNVNEAPDTPVLTQSRGTVSEPLSGSLADGWVARFAVSDVDGPVPGLRLVSNPLSMFTVVGNEVRFANGVGPDFETLVASGRAASDSDGDGLMEVVLSGSVDASDGVLSSTGTASFSIRVEDVNEAPTALNWTAGLGSIIERDRIASGVARPAVEIGTLSVNDPDTPGFANGSYSYTVSDSRFEIVGNVLRLREGASLDYEAGSSVTLTVTATDQSSAPLSIGRTITVVVGDADDVLQGDDNSNALLGQQGRDLIYGYGGDDVLDGAAGNDVLDGGAGDDQLYGRDGLDTLSGGDGADRLHGGDGDDNLDGGAGDDILFGGLGRDGLAGGLGSDWADYSEVRPGEADSAGVTVDIDTPSNNAGAALGDRLSGIENLRGTSAIDVLTGDANANRLEGLGGNDILRGKAGDDTLVGGAGDDQLYGDDGADTLIGDDGNDIIWGGAGNDRLFGGAGNDQLYADSGDDYLDGGAGNDILKGGIDNDTYIVTLWSGSDVIENYDPSGDDIDVIGFQDTNGAINDDDLWFEKVGNDMRISVIGTDSSVLIKDWYLISDATTRANYKIDFIVADQRYSSQINVEGLVQLMAGRTRPATTGARDALMADLTYKANWATYWGQNAKPVMSAIANQIVQEDGTIVLSLTATDDITPNANLQMSASVISGGAVIANGGLVFGPADANGVRSLTIRPNANASGTATIQVQATDAGGVTETRQFTVTVNPVADTPTIAQFTGGSGTANQTGGIPLSLSVTFPDSDGSEVQEIWISGVPQNVSLSAGTFDSATGVWKLTPAQVTGLTVNAPAGWSQDLALSVTARATEGGQTAVSSTRTTTVVINAPPTGAGLNALQGGQNWGFDGGQVQGWRAANGTLSGGTSGIVFTGNGVGDPIMVSPAGLSIAGASNYLVQVRVRSIGADVTGHAQLFYTTAGHSESEGFTKFIFDKTFKANEWVTLTFDMRTLTAGGSDWLNNVITGLRFDMPNVANTSFEVDSVMVGYDSGGTFVPGATSVTVAENSANGDDVGYAFAIDADAGDRHSYVLIDSAGGRFSLTAGGLLEVANGSLLNFEGATSHLITVDVTDGFNQTRRQTLTVNVGNVNEANSLPSTYSMNVNENVGVGTLVGTVAATDLDSAATAFGQQRYYFRNGTTVSLTSADGRYSIDTVTGQIRTTAALNFEAGNTSVTYTVVARDNQGNPGYLETLSAVTIGINNLNEPNNINGTTFYISENQPVGTAVGTATVADPDSASTLFGQQRFWFWDGTNYSDRSWDGRYRIDNVTGIVSTNAALDFEGADPGRNYVIRARDNAGNPGYNETAGNFWIQITNVNEAPYSSGGNYWAMFDETGYGSNPANGGVVVRTLPLTDPDGTTPTLEFTANPNGWFTIVGNQIRFTGYNMDFEYFRSLGYGVGDYDGDGRIEAHIADVWTRTNDGQYVSDATPTQVFIHDINEPHWLSNLSFNFNEGTYPTLYTVANPNQQMLNEYDQGALRAKSWSFLDGSLTSGIFQINGSTGEISLINGSVDYESLIEVWEWQEVWVEDGRDPYGSSGYYEEQYVYMGRDPSRATFNLGIRATDTAANGSTYTSTATATVTVNDVNEAPSVTARAGYAGDTDSGVVYTQGPTTFWVRANRNEGQLIVLSAYDPEQASSTFYYSMTTPQIQEIFYAWGGSSEADGHAPVLSITPSGASGQIFFYSDNDGEWEGAYRDASGQRRTSTLYYRFNVSVWDTSGVTTTLPFEVVFLRRNSSVPPIMLDLDGDGLELVDSETSTIQFDMDEDGIKDRTGWIGADDGMLVLDRNHNGTIDDINEISFADDSAGAISDLEGLRAFDTNANGLFDAGDQQFAEFRIWQDANQDGVSQADELRSLAERGVVSISLNFTPTGQSLDGAGNITYSTTEFFRADGTTGAVGDVFLSFDPSDVEKIAAPIVFDFDKDGAGLLSLTASNVRFDMDGDGAAERTGWIEAGDAFLALDRDGDGKIGDIAEISFVGDLAGAKTDLEGLRAFDSNGDGLLSALDNRFAEFKLWFDNNSNGVSDAGEIKSLAEAGVVSLSLTSTAADGRSDGGNVIYGVAGFTLRDGSTGHALDTGLVYNPGDGSAGTSRSAWTGGPTPSTSGQPLAPAINVERRDFERKANKYLLASANGQVFVRYAKEGAALDGRAGLITAASILKFKNKTYGMLSPIILDLDGNGVEMRSIKKAKASFDMNGDGIADDTGWAGKSEGFLVIDRDGDGRITTASELGFLADKPGARSSLDALAALDSNRDGKLDATDARFGELKLWVDADGDGVTDSGELKSLADHGIASISLSAQGVEQQAGIGSNLITATTTFTRTDGSTGTVGDVALSYKPGERPAVRPAAAPASAPVGDALWAMRAAMLDNHSWQRNRGGIEARVDDALGANVVDMLPHCELSSSKDTVDPASPAAALDRIALMRQAMASFGARSGELDLVRRPDDRPGSFDFYAAA